MKIISSFLSNTTIHKWKAAMLLLIPALLAGWSANYLFMHRFIPSQSTMRVGDLMPTKVIGIFVDKPVVDVGLISEQSTPHATFTLFNKGASVATIEKLETSCGCTTAEATAYDIQPGSSVPIQIALDPARLGGATFTKFIAVRFKNTKDVIAISVIGTVDKKNLFSVYPSVVNGIPMLAGGFTKESLFVRGSPSMIADLPESIRVVLDGAPTEILTNFDSIDSRIADRGISLIIEAPQSLGLGIHHGIIRFVQESPKTKEVVIKIQAEIAQPVVSTPKSLLLSNGRASFQLRMLDSSPIHDPVFKPTPGIETFIFRETSSSLRVSVAASGTSIGDGEIKIEFPTQEHSLSIPFVVLK